jgi:hypothetical protein
VGVELAQRNWWKSGCPRLGWAMADKAALFTSHKYMFLVDVLLRMYLGSCLSFFSDGGWEVFVLQTVNGNLGTQHGFRVVIYSLTMFSKIFLFLLA